ncbi:TPA: hypothetical protein JD344_04350 [Serratia marcescens]|nr:hypothetical protein [Serratia marcescens]HAU5738039.1 hypothetical protein [Serratia marcescens]HAU5743600.1 hypothetical protein [Serratia marcescens]HAU5753949.1 hypothetical protein [Serratia marcescens]HAU5763238.1 hypothetical protein [Serratia marcescens]
MMATDSLRIIVLSGVSFCWPLSCRRACSASASALHFALPPAQPSHVQASCLEHGWPAAIAVFAGALAAGAALPPGRSCRDREPGGQGEANAEGKTKGRGTGPRRKPVCTWGWRGTERLCRRAAWGAKPAPMQSCPRASHARTRQSLQGAQP